MMEAVKIIVFFLFLTLMIGISLQPCFLNRAGKTGKESGLVYPGYQHSLEPSPG